MKLLACFQIIWKQGYVSLKCCKQKGVAADSILQTLIPLYWSSCIAQNELHNYLMFASIPMQKVLQ